MPAIAGPHEPGGRSDDSDLVRARGCGAARLRTCGAVLVADVGRQGAGRAPAEPRTRTAAHPRVRLLSAAKGDALRERPSLTPANRSR